MINSYRDLVVWKKAIELTVDCYRFTAEFPRTETCGITLQLRKSAASVPANIAEGRGRRTTREFLRFIDIAYGSLTELETHIHLAMRLGYCTVDVTDALLARTDEIARMLNGLRRSLDVRQPRQRPLNPES